MPRESNHAASKLRATMESSALESTLESKAFEAAIGIHLDRLPYGSFKAFGRAVNRSDTWVGRMRDPFDSTHIRASQIGVACQAVGSVQPINEVLAEVRIAGRRWHVVPIPEVAAVEDLGVDAAEMVGEAASYAASLARFSIGGLDRDELAKLERQLVNLHEAVIAQLSDVRAQVAAR